ncbi:hypothetical protein B0F90DRAFT_1691928 [Multifurca ochricompacta]|uniref:Uncharacterized protein n=1 Tax=Multifurca ochricompacta TaxID=376703 RepID=A0AAD4MB70_9AGAM|nr:hypothetical protein B0F90DRAFT_1691928 [Multifurca ochricompacta]
MTTTDHSLIELTDLLLSTPYRLAYAIPLLVLSTLLAFAGSFLTLDRTRSFQPRSSALQVPGSFNLTKRPKRLHLYLQGGLGGVAIGYSFGLHLSTFLALIAPNETTSTPLSSKSFLAVWVLTSVPFSIFSGLFRLAAFAFVGITGGACPVHLNSPQSFDTAHFLALLAPICCILTVLPSARTQRNSIRLTACATGAFGLTISISLLAHIQPWSNVWERLFIADGNGWGIGIERVLSAGYWFILIAGCSADWALKKFCGGNPDEEWDMYLVEYASSLPTSRDRAGVFQPLSYSFWERLFPRTQQSKPSVVSDYFPPPGDKHSSSSPLSFDHRRPGVLSKRPAMQQAFTFTDSPRPKQSHRPLSRLLGLKKAESHGYRKREAVKFDAIDPEDLSSDDEDDPLSTPPPLARRTSTRSSVTLTNGSTTGSQRLSPAKDSKKATAAKYAGLEGNDGGATEYSDYEDVTKAQPHTAEQRDSPGWKPPPVAPVGAVPMTPSLIRAVDRIAAAQSQAYGSPAPTDSSHTSTRKQRWETFWRDVTDKIAEGTNVR